MKHVASLLVCILLMWIGTGQEEAKAAGSGEVLLHGPARLKCDEVLEVKLPDLAPLPSKCYLAFEARIDAERYKSGSSPCCRVAVNSLPTSIERLRNKRSYYFPNPEQRIPWYDPTRSAWTIPYHPWENKNIAGGQAHAFVIDIADLLKPTGNVVTFTSLIQVHDAVVEIRNVYLLTHDDFPKAPDLGEKDPATQSHGLARFRKKALGYHEGATARLHTGNPFKEDIGRFAPRRDFRQDYELNIDADGKIHLRFAGDEYEAFSYFMFPELGWFQIGAPENDPMGWEKFSTENSTVTAVNAKAILRRTITQRDSHVEIRDEFTNKTDADLPVVVMNCVDIAHVADLTEFRISGMCQDRFWASTSPMQGRQFAATPVIYLCKKNSAIGVVVEDDAYRNQASVLVWDSILGIGDDMFYLEPRAKYAFVWKLFPVPDRNYYTLVNAVRHHWNLFQKIPGLFGFVMPHSQERFYESARIEKTPEKIAEFLGDTGMAFNGAGSVHPDARQKRLTILYGNEEIGLLRQGLTHFKNWRDAARAGGATTTFLPYVNVHLCRIVHGKTLADAEKRLPGCLIRDAFDTPVAYRPGWLYCFLPTLDNACGQHLLNVMRMYLDEEGFDGIYLDEWDHSRARVSFTHEDGVSALLDESGKILKKVGIVPIMTKAFQVKFIEELTKRNAVVFANQFDDTLTAAQLPVIHFAEPSFSYDSYLLAAAQISRTPHSLHIHKTRGIWNDAKEFLKRGILMCYYWRYFHGDHVLKRYYPITVKELWPGVIVGEDKIITCCSGTFTLGRGRPLTAYIFQGPKGLLAKTQKAAKEKDRQTDIDLSLTSDQIAVIVED